MAAARIEVDEAGDLTAPLLAALPRDHPLQAAVVLKRTGVLLGGWAQDGVPRDVVALMAATLVGSVDTLIDALGRPPSRDIVSIAGDRLLLLTPMDPGTLLLLAAPEHVGSDMLRELARSISKTLRLPRPPGRPRGSGSRPPGKAPPAGRRD